MRGQKDYQISPQCIPSDQQMPFEYGKDIQSSLLGKTVVVYNIIRMIAQICNILGEDVMVLSVILAI